jgi:type IV pilus assembly protein PilM
VNIGSDVTNINIIQNNVPYFTRDLSVGSNVFVEAVQREMGVTFDEADAMLSGQAEIEDEERFHEIVAGAANEISMGIERSIAFLKTAGDAENIDRLILSGGGARVPGLAEILAEKHGVDITTNDAVMRIARDDDAFADDQVEQVGPLLTVALGLALRREGN